MWGNYTILVTGRIQLWVGFRLRRTGAERHGDAKWFPLRLTDSGLREAGSAWYPTKQNIQSFTQDFSFQMTKPTADGITFAIQNVGTTALGSYAGSLGYAPDP